MTTLQTKSWETTCCRSSCLHPLTCLQELSPLRSPLKGDGQHLSSRSKMAATLLYITSLPLSDVVFAPHQSKKLIPVQSRTITTVVFWLGPPALWIWNEAITMRLAGWNLREQTSQKWKICSLLTHTLVENSVFGGGGHWSKMSDNKRSQKIFRTSSQFLLLQNVGE